jgi:hypothetical protein
MTRNRPKHAVYGVTQGVNQFGTSVASGVAGLVVICHLCLFTTCYVFIETDNIIETSDGRCI